MLAIMGPSGAGKTSLLDILSGYRQIGVSGSVSVDGKRLPAGNRFMRRIAGYVRQDDILPGTSTVFEYLLFNAALRMSQSVTRFQKEERVFHVLQELGLTKVAHNFIGDQFTRGLSGTEKSLNLLFFYSLPRRREKKSEHCLRASCRTSFGVHG